ncbi:chorismate mutase, partial [Streptococcus suis]
MNLEHIREQINSIDSQLVDLLEQRMELVDQVTA